MRSSRDLGMTFGGGQSSPQNRPSNMDFDAGSLKPDILRTLDLTRMEKKPMDCTDDQAQ